MSAEHHDLVQSFVEDCREHLDSIEASLMDMEAAGERQNPELVNAVFRLAHSIKGGAGMLGLDTIKTLAHKLENVLHMVRSRELVPTHAVVDVLLRGFDRLTELVDNVHDSEPMPIQAEVERLEAICRQAGGDKAAAAPARISLPGSGIFQVDAVSLAQATSGGNELYLLEVDLIHDIHGKGRMPFEVLKALTDTGRIVDCMVDLAAVGDLEGFGNSIPFYVLYATILEPRYVSSLVKLPDDRVRHLDEAPGVVQIAPARDFSESHGGLVLQSQDGAGSLRLPEHISGEVLADLRAALLAALERCDSLVLDWSGVTRCDLFLHQLLLSAQRSFAARSKLLFGSGPMPEELRQACAVQGLCALDAPGPLAVAF